MEWKVLKESPCSSFRCVQIQILVHSLTRIPSERLCSAWRCGFEIGRPTSVPRYRSKWKKLASLTAHHTSVLVCHSRLCPHAHLTMTAYGTESLQQHSCWSSILHHSVFPTPSAQLEDTVRHTHTNTHCTKAVTGSCAKSEDRCTLSWGEQAKVKSIKGHT